MRENIDRYPKPKRMDYRKLTELMIETHGNSCRWCGYTRPGFEPIVHHIDCNPNNNCMENIMPLCCRCHRVFHQIFPNWRFLTDDEIREILKHGRKVLKENAWRKGRTW